MTATVSLPKETAAYVGLFVVVQFATYLNFGVGPARVVFLIALLALVALLRMGVLRGVRNNRSSQ